MAHHRQTIRLVSTKLHGRFAQVFDAETGEELSGVVSRVAVAVDAVEMSTAQVVLIQPQFDVVAVADIETVAIDMNDRASLERAISALRARLSILMHTQEPPYAV